MPPRPDADELSAQGSKTVARSALAAAVLDWYAAPCVRSAALYMRHSLKEIMKLEKRQGALVGASAWLEDVDLGERFSVNDVLAVLNQGNHSAVTRHFTSGPPLVRLHGEAFDCYKLAIMYVPADQHVVCSPAVSSAG